MGALACCGPESIAIELRKIVSSAGMAVFKLSVDDSSILLSVDVVPGNTLSRKAHYVPYAPGRLEGAFSDMCQWLRKVKGVQ